MESHPQELYSPPLNHSSEYGDRLSLDASICQGSSLAAAPSVIWNRLESLGAKIDRWRFVRDYDSLPEIVWEMWKCHRRSRTTHLFTEALHGEILRGDEYIAGLISITGDTLERNEDLKLWSMELADLLSKVHMAVAALKCRLEQVQNGLVRKHPNILCPPHLDP